MPSTSSRRGLLALAAASLLGLLYFGVRHGFGLFLPPMTATYGWGREVFGLAIAVQVLLWGLALPLAGLLADRYGSGRILALGGLFYALGLYGTARAESPFMLVMTLGVLVALGLGFASFSIAIGVVSRAVSEDKRSLYTGIVMAGSSVGMLTITPLELVLIESIGWQTTLDVLAVLILTIVLLAAFLTGKPATSTRGEAVESIPGGVSVQGPLEAVLHAVSQKRFWLLFWGFFVCGFHVTFVATHLPAYIQDQGGAASLGTLALSLIGLFNLFGSLLSGYIGGKISKRIGLSVLYLLRAGVFALFVVLPVTPTSVIVFSMLLGLLWLSTVPLTSGLVGQIYGLRYFASLFGLVFLGHQVGSFLGVWAGGWVFDVTGSYNVVWYASIGLGVFAALIHWPIDERSDEAFSAPAVQPLPESSPA